MLTVADPARYARHRRARESDSSSGGIRRELFLPVLLFGCMGAIAWALRGSNGWNGIDGTVVPGMLWGILWWYLCIRKGIRANSAPLWLGLGIAVGGELGYGIYVSWIRGIFMLDTNNEVISIAPSLGWLWFFICGIGWGAPGGICLGWALSTKRSLWIWIPRIVVPCLAYHGAAYLVQAFPDFFLPNGDLLDYSDESNSMAGRIIWTQTLNTKVLCAWLAAMGVALVQRDTCSYTVNGIIGGGFGLGFMVSAGWCLGYGSEAYAQSIDWWKVWELNAGFFLGGLYALALWWSIRQMDKRYDPDGAPLSDEDFTHPAWEWNLRTLIEMVGVAVLTMTIYYEDSFPTSVAMCGLFVCATGLLVMQTLNGLTPEERDIRRARVAQSFCTFLCIFVMLRGWTSSLGTLLGTHSHEMVDQYSWPIERVWLFAPMAMVIVAGTVWHFARVFRGQGDLSTEPSVLVSLPRCLSVMFIATTVIGIIAVWPANVGWVNPVFLVGALWTLRVLNRLLNLLNSA